MSSSFSEIGSRDTRVSTPEQLREKYRKIISDYENKKSDEHKDASDIIDEAVKGRQAFDTLFKSVNNVIASDMESDMLLQVDNGNGEELEINDLFAINVGNTEALTIMNTKAAVFDVSAINVNLKPRGIEDYKDETFLTLNAFINSYLELPQFEIAFADAIKYSRGYPMAVTLVGWDNTIHRGGSASTLNGDIVTTNIKIDNFWWDPASTSVDGCEYAIIQDFYTFRKLKKMLAQYKDLNMELLEAACFSTQDSYSFGRDSISEGNIQSNSSQVQNGAIPMKTIFLKNQISDTKCNIKIFFVIKDKYVVATTTWDIPMLPFSILKESSLPGVFTGISSVMMALPYIKTKHIIDSTCNNIVLAQKNPTYVVSNTSGLSAEDIDSIQQASTSSKTIVVNGEINGAISLLAPPELSPDTLNWRDRIDSEIQKSVSVTDITNGVQFGSALSGAGVQSMIQQATAKENTSVTELKRYLVRFTKIMFEFLKSNIINTEGAKNTSKFFRVKNTRREKGKDLYDMIELNKEDFSKLTSYDIDIDVSMLKTSNKQQQKQDLFTLFQMGLQYKSPKSVITIEELLDTLYLPADTKLSILDRIKEESIDKAYEQANQLVNMVLSLQQDPEYQGMEISQLVASAAEQMQQSTLPTSDYNKGGK